MNQFKSFIWGAATASYQIEGAWSEDGKGASIWDTFCRQEGKIQGNMTGDITCDHYHLWQKDVQLMRELNLQAYRFSLSWPRILPDGTTKLINEKGLEFYDKLIDSLLEANILPFVTLYHWDLPQNLQDMGGWGVRETALRFAEFVELVAHRYKDRVKHWITINEPYVAAFAGHLHGVHAPGKQSPVLAMLASHHLMLAHGKAVKVLRSITQLSEIGIALNLSPVFPFDPNSEDDQFAAQNYFLYLNRLFLNLIYHKQYPKEILEMANKNQKDFSSFLNAILPQDLEEIGQEIDYLGVNYYTKTVVKLDLQAPLFKACLTEIVKNKYSDLWDYYPEGLSYVLDMLQTLYQPKKIYITENGTAISEKQNDQARIEYIQAHLNQIELAMKKGVNIQGYFVWSLLDNFEWSYGFSKRFGLIYVNFETQERHLKQSAKWYAELIKDKRCQRF